MSLPENNYPVVCYGEILWDVLPTGAVPGGAPMNVSYHLNKLGVSPALISRVGLDDEGKKLIQLMEKNNISTDYFQMDFDLVTGKVTKLASFGAFVQLQDDIDGLVHISQLSEEHVAKVKDVLKVGQEVEARVIKVDKAERRIGLSIKAAHYSDEELRRETEAFDSLRPGEDMVGLEQAFQAAEEEYRPGDRKR